MTCKGCLRRKAKLKKWLRGLLGVASVAWVKETILKLDRHTDEHIHKHYNELKYKYEALDALCGKWLKEVQSQLDALDGNTKSRLSTLRELNKNCKEMIRSQDDRIVVLEQTLSDQAEAIRQLEFPSPEQIAYKTTPEE